MYQNKNKFTIMKKENIIIGAIAVIGALTLFNTYSIFTKKSRVVATPTSQANNVGAVNPSTLPETNDFANNFDQPQKPQVQAPAAPTGPLTSLNFKTPKKDFGQVLSTSSNKHTFKFTNTGTEPLIISNAKGSCGCTVPKWPKEPIAPGETGEIAVEYKPAGQSGVQTKYVTITANTSPATTQLTITGDIQADPNAPQQPAQPIAPEGINIQ